MDLRNAEDDRPYRGVNRTQYTTPSQNDDYYEDNMSTQAYYRERLRNVTEQRWFPLAAVTLGVIVFGSLVAFAYRQGADTSANSTTPLIQADSTSYKEKPVNPGGMDVPFQDAVVFDQLDKTKTADAGNVENLLPPPEQPVESNPKATEAAPPSAPKPEADKGVIASTNAAEDDSVAAKIAATEATMKAKTGTAEDAATQSETVAQTIANATPVVDKTGTAKTTTQQTANVVTSAKADTVVTSKTTTKTVTAAKTPTTMDDVVKTSTASTTVAHATTPAKMNAVAPAAPTPVAKASGGTAKIQLGAFKDESAAKAAWVHLQQQYAPHLNGVTPNYARADLGAKGVFYRVQGVNISKTQAQDICQAINASKAGACIIPQ